MRNSTQAMNAVNSDSCLPSNSPTDSQLRDINGLTLNDLLEQQRNMPKKWLPAIGASPSQGCFDLEKHRRKNKNV